MDRWAMVEAKDKSTQNVTLKGPEGKTVEVKARDPKHLEGAKPGDDVVITLRNMPSFFKEAYRQGH